MSNVKNLILLSYLILQYFLFQMGWRKAPEVQRLYDASLTGLAFLFGWRRKVRFVGAEDFPQKGPAIIASNHIEIDDPFVTGNAVFVLSGRNIRPRVMMRDDFFVGMPRWLKKIVDPDEVAQLIGAILITRQGADEAQLLPFVDVLRNGEVFLIYPGRSRSRSGMFIDYRDWIRSPGATSQFVAGGQEGRAKPAIPTIPVTRTRNPVTRRSALVFGKPLYLAPGADRAEQRVFDLQLVVAMSDLIEINVPHVVSAILYLHCLHGGADTMPFSALRDAVGSVFADIRRPPDAGCRNYPVRYTDPAALNGLDREINRTLKFLSGNRALARRGSVIRLNPSVILSVPQSFSRYRSQNPVKYLVNQILHLPDVVSSIERAAERLR